MGTNESEAADLAKSQPGWTVDEATKMIMPKEKETPTVQTVSSEAKMEQLTKYISFLEK